MSSFLLDFFRLLIGHQKLDSIRHKREALFVSGDMSSH